MYKNYTQKLGVPTRHTHKFLLVISPAHVIKAAGRRKIIMRAALTVLMLTGPIAQVSAAAYSSKLASQKEVAWTKTTAPMAHIVTGVVKDTTGVAMPGVSILNKTTGKGAATDTKGAFKIEADPGDVLVFTFVGFIKQSVTVGAETRLTIILHETSNQLNAVVITALGIKKSSKSLTYNVQTLKAEEVTRVPDASFVNSLAGKVAGVTINASSSGIGGSTRVVMRGDKSLFGNNNVLYVLDGIPLPSLISGSGNWDEAASGGYYKGGGSDGISSLNPEDIESITVLTGASSSALYGSLAANGVILVNTKSGARANKTHISFANSSGFYNPLLMPRFQNNYGASAPGNFDSWSETRLGTPSTYKPGDYLQTGTNISNSISLSTGTETSQTYLSAAADNARQIIPGSTFDRYNLTLHQTNEFLNNKLKLDLNAKYIKSQNTNSYAQGLYANPLVGLYLFPRSDDIGKYQAYERYDLARNLPVQYWPENYQFGSAHLENPFWVMNREPSVVARERYILNSGLSYQVLNWLNLAARVQADKTAQKSVDKRYATTNTTFTNGSANGYYGEGYQDTRQTYADFIAKTHNTFKNFALNGIVGASLTNTTNTHSTFGGGLADLGVANVFAVNNIGIVTPGPGGDDASNYRLRNQAIFGSAELSYKNSLFFTVTGRNEWSSALSGAIKKSFFYPSIGLGAVISDMVKLPHNIISYLKLRGSFTEVGNTLPPFITETYFTITPGSFNINANLPFTGLKPERTHSIEAGFNSRFVNDIITFDVTLYNTNTFNQFFKLPLPGSGGASYYYINAGQVNNKGIEAGLSANINLGKVQWTPSVVFSLNRNKLVSLINNVIPPYGGPPISLDQFPATGAPLMKLGKPLGEVFVTGAQTDPNGYFVVNEDAGTGPNAVILKDNNTLIDAGNTNPKYNLGFRNGFSYKNFDVNFLIDYRNGGVVQSFTQSTLDFLGASQASGEARDKGGVIVNGALMDASAYYKSIGNGQAMAFYVYSATNARLREASISYSIPGKVFKNVLSNVTLSLIGRNLFMFYNKAPFDPEVTASTGTFYQGVDNFMQPSLRSFGFSIKAAL